MTGRDVIGWRQDHPPCTAVCHWSTAAWG